MTDDLRRRRVLQASALAMAGIAGCTGDGDDGGDGATPTDEATPTATATDGEMATPTATEGGDPTATATPTATDTPSAQPDQVVRVGANGLNFEPDSFSIAAGDTVLWDWVGSGHNVSPDGQPDGADWAGDDESTYGDGHTYAYTFEVTGTYSYHCDPHQSSGMRGSFTVE